MDEAKRARELLAKVVPAVAPQRKKGYLLDHLAWPRSVEERFFAAGAGGLPEVEYAPDRDGQEAHIAELSALLPAIDGDDPIATWLRRVVESRIAEGRLILAMGSGAFTER